MKIEKNKILLGDCMDLMAEMPDNYIDLAIVDCPYGTGWDGGNIITNPKRPCRDFRLNNPKYKKKEWDVKPDKKYFDELFKVSKNQIIWGGNYFIDFLESTPCFIFWDKRYENQKFADGELAWTSFKTGIKKFTLSSKAETRGGLLRIHPTQKPIALYRWILQNYVKPGQLILDTHSGSGSLACACHLEKFDFIAIEKDPDYHKSSTERFETLKSQGVLF